MKTPLKEDESCRTYGSGYPGIAGRGVAGRGFPFFFWPLAWGGVAALGVGAYLDTDEVSHYYFPVSHERSHYVRRSTARRTTAAGQAGPW